MTLDIDSLKRKILNQALVLFDDCSPCTQETGLKNRLPEWDMSFMKASAERAEIDFVLVDELFPDGVMDILSFWFQCIDQAMVEQFSSLTPLPQKIRDKIAESVMIRLELLQPHKQALYKAWIFLSRPDRSAYAYRLLFRTCDTMWTMIGDRSHDWNYYSKRMLLSGVYQTTLMAWFQDDDPHMKETREFLHRRIGNVMQIQTIRPNLDRWTQKIRQKFSF